MSHLIVGPVSSLGIRYNLGLISLWGLIIEKLKKSFIHHWF